MTTLQLNAELFSELSTISTDEGMMRKAIKALKRIIKQHQKEAMDETEYIMSSPAMVKILEEGQQQIKEGRDLHLVKLENLWK